MGKFSDRREPHTKERPKSVLKRHSNSCLTHELYDHWRGPKEKAETKRRNKGAKTRCCPVVESKSLESNSSQVNTSLNKISTFHEDKRIQNQSLQ